MRFSLIAFIMSLGSSILSMGFLGIGLFFIAAPVLTIIFPNVPKDMNTWQGDWVSPAMIGIPILWSFGFLIAGCIYLYLKQLDWTHLTLKTSYAVTLLLFNALLWLLLLLTVNPQIS